MSRTGPGPPAAVVLNAWLDGAAIFIVCRDVVEDLLEKVRETLQVCLNLQIRGSCKLLMRLAV